MSFFSLWWACLWSLVCSSKWTGNGGLGSIMRSSSSWSALTTAVMARRPSRPPTTWPRPRRGRCTAAQSAALIPKKFVSIGKTRKTSAAVEMFSFFQGFFSVGMFWPWEAVLVFLLLSFPWRKGRKMFFLFIVRSFFYRGWKNFDKTFAFMRPRHVRDHPKMTSARGQGEGKGTSWRTTISGRGLKPEGRRPFLAGGGGSPAS